MGVGHTDYGEEPQPPSAPPLLQQSLGAAEGGGAAAQQDTPPAGCADGTVPAACPKEGRAAEEAPCHEHAGSDASVAAEPAVTGGTAGRCGGVGLPVPPATVCGAATAAPQTAVGADELEARARLLMEGQGFESLEDVEEELLDAQKDLEVCVANGNEKKAEGMRDGISTLQQIVDNFTRAKQLREGGAAKAESDLQDHEARLQEALAAVSLSTIAAVQPRLAKAQQRLPRAKDQAAKEQLQWKVDALTAILQLHQATEDLRRAVAGSVCHTQHPPASASSTVPCDDVATTPPASGSPPEVGGAEADALAKAQRDLQDHEARLQEALTDAALSTIADVQTRLAKAQQRLPRAKDDAAKARRQGRIDAFTAILQLHQATEDLRRAVAGSVCHTQHPPTSDSPEARAMEVEGFESLEDVEDELLYAQKELEVCVANGNEKKAEEMRDFISTLQQIVDDFTRAKQLREGGAAKAESDLQDHEARLQEALADEALSTIADVQTRLAEAQQRLSRAKGDAAKARLQGEVDALTAILQLHQATEDLRRAVAGSVCHTQHPPASASSTVPCDDVATTPPASGSPPEVGGAEADALAKAESDLQDHEARLQEALADEALSTIADVQTRLAEAQQHLSCAKGAAAKGRLQGEVDALTAILQLHQATEDLRRAVAGSVCHTQHPPASASSTVPCDDVATTPPASGSPPEVGGAEADALAQAVQLGCEQAELEEKLKQPEALEVAGKELTRKKMQCKRAVLLCQWLRAHPEADGTDRHREARQMLDDLAGKGAPPFDVVEAAAQAKLKGLMVQQELENEGYNTAEDVKTALKNAHQRVAKGNSQLAGAMVQLLEKLVCDIGEAAVLAETENRMMSDYTSTCEGWVRVETDDIRRQLDAQKKKDAAPCMRDIAKSMHVNIACSKQMSFLRRHASKSPALRAYVETEIQVGNHLCHTRGGIAADAACAKEVHALCERLKAAHSDSCVDVWVRRAEALRDDALASATKDVGKVTKCNLENYKDPGVPNVQLLLTELDQAAAHYPAFRDLHGSLYDTVKACVGSAFAGCDVETARGHVILEILEGLRNLLPDSLLDRAALDDLRQKCNTHDRAMEQQWEDSSKHIIDAINVLSQTYNFSRATAIRAEVLTTVGRSIACLDTCNLPSVMEKLFAEVPMMVRFAKSMKSSASWCSLTLKNQHTMAETLISSLCTYFHDRVRQYCSEQLPLVCAAEPLLKALHEKVPVVLKVLQQVVAYKAAPIQKTKGTLLGQMSCNERNAVETCTTQLKSRMAAAVGALGRRVHAAVEQGDVHEMCDLYGAMQTYSDVIGQVVVQFEVDPEFTYAAVQRHLNRKLMEAKRVAQQSLFDAQAQSQDTVTRRDFFTQLHEAVLLLEHSAALQDHLDSTVGDILMVHRVVVDKMKDGAIKIHGELVSILEQQCPTKQDLRQLNTMWSSLQDACAAFTGHEVGEEARRVLDRFDRAVTAKNELHINNLGTSVGDETARQLVALKVQGLHAPLLLKHSNATIERLLTKLLRSTCGGLTALIPKLQRYGDEEHASEALMLLEDHKAFQGAAVALRNQKTLCHDIDYVLGAMKKDTRNDKFDSAKVRTLHTQFSKVYWEWVDKGMRETGVAQAVVQAAQDIACGSGTAVHKAVRIAAAVCAHWTLSFTGGDTDKQSLLQPHPAQVVSVLRLLGADSGGKLAHHLAEIGTGEGKSVTVAVCAVVLALLGYEVDCVCYSAFLGTRDDQDFDALFQAFSVRSVIRYSTFNQACEVLLNEKLPLREAVEATIAGMRGGMYTTQQSGRKRVAIIDEVDTFLGEDFYGNSYPVLARVHGPSVLTLFQYVWRKTKGGKARLTAGEVQRSPEYKACAAYLRGWEELLEQAVQAMLVAVRDPLTGYVVVDGRIGFPNQHGVTFSRCCYRTAFAYYMEHERDASKVSVATCNEFSVLLVRCGVFSYAAIPSQYEHILGVTGTLSALTQQERDLLRKDYGIAKYSYLPSVYGKNQLKFAGDTPGDVVIDTRAGHSLALTKEIQKRHGRGRPVIVFFVDREALQEYMMGVHFQGTPFKDHVVTLTEAESDDEKFSRVRQSMLRNMVTLAVRSFARGTDFKCYDKAVLEWGGVHVVTTYVPDELSEETQLKGRAARQGDDGSFSMVLAEEDLERFGLFEDGVVEMKATNSLWTTINRCRNKAAGEHFQERMRNQDDTLKAEHDASMGFSSVLQSGDKAAVHSFLKQQNKVMGGVDKRILVLMDATSSMRNVITKTKHSVSAMFSRVFTTLDEANHPAGCAIQFAVYRNYGERQETLLQHSGFEVSSTELESFMSTVRASSTRGGTGWANEAIEIGLWHANRLAETEEGLDEVILIGDAPANTPEQVVSARADHHGEDYWKTTPYASRTTASEQVPELANRGVPVHAFHVVSRQGVADCFEQLAEQTGGQCGPLDVDSDQGHERLTQLVSERVLDTLGGDDLLQRYRARYGHIALA